jgi:hypothetical protein
MTEPFIALLKGRPNAQNGRRTAPLGNPTRRRRSNPSERFGAARFRGGFVPVKAASRQLSFQVGDCAVA